MSRQAIKGAPYNPRTIDIHAKKKLEKNIRAVGLIQPIVVNLRSVEKGWPEGSEPTIVSGHQRLSAIDSIEAKANYELDVAMVDLTEEQEKTQNIFMNNQDAMGTWDVNELESLLSSLDKDVLTDTGFDAMGLATIFDDEKLAKFFDAASQPEEVNEAIDELARIKEIEGIKEAKKLRGHERFNDSENYAVIVFKSREDQTEFVEMCGLPSDARYVDSDAVWRLIEAEGDASEEELAVAKEASPA